MADKPLPGSLNVRQMRAYLASLSDRMPMFTITDHPADFPDFYVARLSLTLPRPAVLDVAIMDESLERLRVTMEALGLTRLERSPQDDPVVVETWL